MGKVVNLQDATGLCGAIAEAGAALAAGGVAVFPTDTVYGIAQAVLANPDGPTRLFSIKRRDPAKVVPLLVSSPADLDRYGVDIPAYARRLAVEHWPGGITLVVAASAEVPEPYRARDATVALRMPDAPLVLGLMRTVGSPLATTSANTSGSPAPTSFSEVEARIVEEADVSIDGGPTLDARASTVVLCTSSRPQIVRHGAVSDDFILGIL